MSAPFIEIQGIDLTLVGMDHTTARAIAAMRGEEPLALPEAHDQDHSTNNIENEEHDGNEGDWADMEDDVEVEDGVEVDDELMQELLQFRCVESSCGIASSL